MLTRCAEAYNSSCSQTVSLSPAISSQLIQPKIAKINKNLFFGNSGSFKVFDVDTTEKLVLVVIGSMPMSICNRFHEQEI